MEERDTIWDHEAAPFGQRTMAFVGSTGPYRVDVDERNQDQVLVTYKSEALRWVVFVKGVQDGVFGLQGMTGGRGDPYDDDGYWFELILSTPAVLRFWGDQALVHEDHEVSDETPPT